MICFANLWTSFCIIRTSVMKDLRHSSFTSTESQFLHVAKHNFLFFVFFSIWLFCHECSRFTGQQMKREAIFLYPLYHFHLLYRHLDISWVIDAESLPLHIAGSRHRTWNLWNTPFRIHPFYTRTDSCCSYENAQNLGTTGKYLLCLIKSDWKIFALFKDSSSLPMFTQLTVIFSF